MRTQLEVLDRKKGLHGREYTLVHTEDGWSVVSEGFSDEINGVTRIFEIQTHSIEEAQKWFDQYTKA